MTTYTKDIEARVEFLTEEKGGRKWPIYSGYRPQFHYDDGQGWDSILHFDGDGIIEPGQTATVYFVFMSPHYHVNHLFSGVRFTLREGIRIIGNGQVIRRIELEKSAKEVIKDDVK